MILVDMNQVTVASIFGVMKSVKQEVDINLLRHIILNNISAIKNKNNCKFSDIILCYDGKNSWRNEEFEHYKAKRKDKTEKEQEIWNGIYKNLNTIREELKPYFHVLHVDGAEADDVIAIMTKINNTSPVTIISSDKDFLQLQSYGKNIKQYSLTTKKYITSVDSEKEIHEFIMKGDAIDGIPNVLSPEDFFVSEAPDKKRQKSITKKVLADSYDKLQSGDIESEPYFDRYDKNRSLIDFSFIPEEVEIRIIENINTLEDSKKGIIDYCTEHGLVNILKSLNGA